MTTDERAALARELAERARFFSELTSLGPAVPVPVPVPVNVDVPVHMSAAAPVPAAAASTSELASTGDLEAVRSHIGDCQRCKLAPGRHSIVFGQGHPDADLMFVGEAPGADEDEQGLAFVGRAGQLLTKIIEAIGMTRDDVYIANILKCRPPQNRNPEPDEILSCAPFLERQIALVRPKVIVALGKFAGQWLLRTAEPISRIRGRVGERDGIRVVPTYHPAYLLRTPSAKREVWEDMKLVKRLLEDGGDGR